MRDDSIDRHHKSIRERDDRLQDIYAKPNIVTITRNEIEKTKKVNKLSE
jgi:hypothetical protein